MAERSNDLRQGRLHALGVAIATKRATRGMRQTDLANELGTSQNAVYQWEKGIVAPGADRLWDIAEALGTTAAELISTAEDVYTNQED